MLSPQSTTVGYTVTEFLLPEIGNISAESLRRMGKKRTEEYFSLRAFIWHMLNARPTVHPSRPTSNGSTGFPLSGSKWVWFPTGFILSQFCVVSGNWNDTLIAGVVAGVGTAVGAWRVLKGRTGDIAGRAVLAPR